MANINVQNIVRKKLPHFIPRHIYVPHNALSQTQRNNYLIDEHEKVDKHACQPFSLKIPLLPDDTIVRQERTINAGA
jgi:hypothetical protein